MFQSLFDILHCDIWEPQLMLSLPMMTREIFFLTLVDDCGRFTSI